MACIKNKKKGEEKLFRDIKPEVRDNVLKRYLRYV